MKESEAQLSREEQKEKIRQRYKGVDPNMLEVIPAKPKVKLFEDTKEKNVAAYCRVSTDDPNQTSSYELQKNHYTDMIQNHEGWNLVGIYADEGISGTSMMHRDELLHLLRDCEAGMVDVIVTKSVSRLARNIRDCIEIVRKLAELDPPVGVLFETEGFFTLEATSEMMLAVLAAAAQEESHTKSEIMNVSVDQRFRRGIFLTPVLLGYDQDENGNLIINEKEAATVRLIFFLYMSGYTCTEIAEDLTDLRQKTKRGNEVWHPGSVLQILQNERYCGDVLARKTFTPNYLNHKSKKNNHDRPQYRQKDHHDAIISRDDFIFVQHLIANNRSGGGRGFLPELHVITTGFFAGYVPVNNRWAAFTAADYLTACRHVKSTAEPAKEEIEVTANSGDLDLRGFEVARSQLFEASRETLAVVFREGKFAFSQECIQRLDGCTHIELLLQPEKRILAVRPSTPEEKNSLRWSHRMADKSVPSGINRTPFLKVIFELMGWQPEYRYRVRGTVQSAEGGSTLFFSLEDTEMFLPEHPPDQPEDQDAIRPFTERRTGEVLAVPNRFAASFGANYYYQSQAEELQRMRSATMNENFVTTAVETENDLHELSVTDHQERKDQIDKLRRSMKEEQPDE